MGTARKQQVLVVNDDPDIRETLAEVLADEGYAVHTAGDGVDALELLTAGRARPSVILLDFMMPRCDGAEFRVASRLRTGMVNLFLGQCRPWRADSRGPHVFRRLSPSRPCFAVVPAERECVLA